MALLLAAACSSTSDDADTVGSEVNAAGDDLVAAFSSEADYDEERAGPTSCPITGVQFTDESRGGPTGWEWDFAGAPGSTEQNPFVDGQPSDGEVTLTVTRGAESDSVTEQVGFAVC